MSGSKKVKSARTCGSRLGAEVIGEIHERLKLGETCAGIARLLGISDATVKYHREKMLDGHPIRRAKGREDISAEIAAERRQRQETRQERSAGLQTRQAQVRQAALDAIRKYVPGYDGRARGQSGLRWHGANGGGRAL
jgi:hypothetical protein